MLFAALDPAGHAPWSVPTFIFSSLGSRKLTQWPVSGRAGKGAEGARPEQKLDSRIESKPRGRSC